MRHRADPEPTDRETAARIHRRAWLRGTVACFLSVTVISLFTAGSCRYHSCHDDDDFDDDCDFDDDDDVGASSPATAPPSHRLERFELTTASTLDEHPVARLERIEGVSLAAWSGTRELDADAFAEFTATVLEVNDDLIGLPRTAGRLELERVDFRRDATVVRYRQVDPSGSPVPGAGTAFRFDLIGDLVEITNRTRLR